ncbi:tyrosine-type recombinase/integrase [Halobellus clavatus]|uniref:Site-specific recombinase XerD n=1 Tax=Halobellus clavatus TaxID=660517 RepID=A0A1H3F3U7_9EURY|nr:tyrosine-type recombinase/integrase [Halobellus clavatus]SDX85651.1 Site-specific recombinase XerD [Halobellus clavatus]
MSRGDNPAHKYRVERDRVKDSALSEKDTKAVLEFLEAHHPDLGSKESLSYNSLEGYGRALRLIAKESDCGLLEHTNDSLVSVFESMLDSLANQTVRQRQAGAIKFYRYHGDKTEVDPDDIPLTDKGDTSVNERDMFSREEVQKMREACSNTRDRCLLELLLYTGQRIRVIQTLRLKDIDLDENVYYLNTDELGLKGAEKSGRKRPLLGATKAVREWIKNHPTGEPDDYLITHLPSATNTSEKGSYLSSPAIWDRLRRIAEEAEVDKPSNAHNFRHYFVTVCHREYDMDISTIKHLIGHSADSVVMESTYSHLTDDDHIQHAREAAQGVGKDPEEPEGSLTPDVCPTCDENLPPAAKACPACGMVFTPDAKATQEQIQDDMYESEGQAQGEEEEAIDELKKVLDENPALKKQLLED